MRKIYDRLRSRRIFSSSTAGNGRPRNGPGPSKPLQHPRSSAVPPRASVWTAWIQICEWAHKWNKPQVNFTSCSVSTGARSTSTSDRKVSWMTCDLFKSRGERPKAHLLTAFRLINTHFKKHTHTQEDNPSYGTYQKPKMVAPEIKEAAAKRANTRVVELPRNLYVICHDSAGAEYTLRWIHSEIYDEGAYNAFAGQLQDGAVIFDVGCVGNRGWMGWLSRWPSHTMADTSPGTIEERHPMQADGPAGVLDPIPSHTHRGGANHHPGRPTDPLFPHNRANYGLYTIFCAQNGPKDLTVHAFEPVPPVADICRANVAQYMPQGFTVCVCVFEAAIGNAVDGIDPDPTVVDLFGHHKAQ